MHVALRPSTTHHAVLMLQSDSLVSANVAEFKRQFMAAAGSHDHAVLDMSQVRFVDSSGMGALISCLKALHGRGGGLKLCALTPPVRALFELMRMHTVFELYNTLAEAT